MTRADASDRPRSAGPVYDDLVMFFAEMFGQHLHVGYWDAASTLAEACVRLTDLVVEKAGVGPGDRVVDIGSGIGGPAIRAGLSTNASVVGVNNSLTQIERARENAEAAGAAVTFQHADAMELPFPDDSFDAGWLLESIMLMADRAAVLREAARVLRPGARLVLTDLLDHSVHRETLREAMAKAEEHRASYGLPRGSHPPMRLTDYLALVEQAGLVAVELLDISARTMAQTYAAVRRILTEERERLVATCGSRPVELYESNLPYIETMVANGWGYGLVVATVPGE